MDSLIWKVDLTLNIYELRNEKYLKTRTCWQKMSASKCTGHCVQCFPCVFSSCQTNEISLLKNLHCPISIFLRMTEHPCFRKRWWNLFPHKRHYWIPASNVNSGINTKGYTVFPRYISFWNELIHIAKQSYKASAVDDLHVPISNNWENTFPFSSSKTRTFNRFVFTSLRHSNRPCIKIGLSLHLTKEFRPKPIKFY